MSEVAAIRQQIENEIASMKQALYGYAVVSSHTMIDRHFANIGNLLDSLSDEIRQPLLEETLEMLEKNA